MQKSTRHAYRLILDLHSLLLHDEGDYANRMPSYSTIPFANSEPFEVIYSQPFKGVQLSWHAGIYATPQHSI